MHGAFLFPVAFPCSENHVDPDHHHHHHHHHRCQHPELAVAETPSPDASAHHFYHYTPKCFLTVHREEGWHEGTTKTTIRAENEVEAHREANNYKFGFRKWKGNVTERPIEDRSDVIKELYSDLTIAKPQEGSVVTIGNIVYVVLFGWWISLIYFLICPVMFLTVCGVPYGKLCSKMAWYFIWPFGKSLEKANGVVKRTIARPQKCEVIPEETDSEDSKHRVRDKDSAPLLVSSPVTVEIPAPERPARQTSNHWVGKALCTYIWLLLGFPVLVVVHSLACVLSWLLVFTIPVAKMNARTLTTVLLLAPEDIQVHTLEKAIGCEHKVVLCCYQAVNVHYYKYTVQGINIFALNLLPLVLFTLIIGYTDQLHNYFSVETRFATAITSIIPLSYYIGMGIASISAQSNFAVGAVVNATFGSITEMTFYITALFRGHRAATKCYEEIVKAALTGTLLGCILFIPGICMIIGGIKHREQRFNSRSAGVSSALLFISIGGMSHTAAAIHFIFAAISHSELFVIFIYSFFLKLFCRPLVYTISVLLPAAYLIGLIFTLKTHSHIYDIHISDGQTAGHHLVHWSRWRALTVLIVATVLMACCADLSTENIEPLLTHSSVSQYFIGVTLLAMVPELPEIVNGIQFALQNNISLSLEVGSCIAVQVCMIQIPLLILFNAFYDVGFVLVFSDIHLWASIFSVVLVNYIFMDGKCDYFQGTVLVVVYLILLALYFFAPSPSSC
uniref:Uncharacterized protein n=1 Tax=Mola mola TaxID=94237 RepID=A0A3Q3VPC4_MOLML